MANIIQRAVLELGIDVPIYRADPTPEGGLTLYLFGGRIVTWTPRQQPADPRQQPADSPAAPPPAQEEEQGDDFTVVPGIGPAGATALQEAGYTTFEQLAAAGDTLKPLLNTYTLTKLRDYLYTHGYDAPPNRPGTGAACCAPTDN